MTMTLTGLQPIIYEALDTVANEPVGIINVVNKDANADTVALNQTIRSYVTPAVTANDITPGVTPPNTGGQALSYIDLLITKSRAIPVQWTGEEQKSVSNQLTNIMRDQFAQAFRALRNEMEADLANALVAGASRAVGTAGTTPFGTQGDISAAANVQQILDDNGAPVGDRHLAVNTSTLAKLRSQGVLFKVNEAGTSDLLRNGVIGRLEGLDLHTSSALKLRTASTGSGYVTSGSTSAGSNSITLATGTGTINAGDVVAFQGDSNNYVANVGVSAPGALTIGNPGLLTTVATGKTATVTSAYTPNVAFHKNAIVLATRVPAMPAGGDAATDVIEVLDPISGITFQIAMYKMYRQVHIEVGAAWGTKVVKQEFIGVLMG